MHDYQSLAMMISQAEENDLILLRISAEEKNRIIKQFNRALLNAQGDGTDVAQIFLKPLISQYQGWGDPALVFGLCLAREGQFIRAEQSLSYAISNTLSNERYLAIAQETLRMVREDIKNPPADLPPITLTDKMKGAAMAESGSPADRKNFQAPILVKASKSPAKIQMATSRERRDIMMRSASGGDEQINDDLDIEDVLTPADRMRGLVRGIVIFAILIILALLVYFVVVPAVKKVSAAEENAERIAFLMDEFDLYKNDPEVGKILEDYAQHFDVDTGDDTVATGDASQMTTPTTSEETTTTTTEMVLAPSINTTAPEGGEETQSSSESETTPSSQEEVAPQ